MPVRRQQFLPRDKPMKIRRPSRPQRSRGAILPLTAISIIGLCGFLALSIDLGMLAVARAQVQDAADAAAIAGARSLDGSAGSNLATSTADATTQATRNTILGTNVNPAEVSVRQGTYHYNYTTQTFSPLFPPGANENYNLTEVTITHTYNTTFAKVIGVSTMTVTGKSTAAHRPRDVAMVLDYSGSMNNESDLWNCESYLGSFLNTPNNTDPVFPQWGPYTPSFSAAGEDAMHVEQHDGRQVQRHDLGQRHSGPRDQLVPEQSRSTRGRRLFAGPRHGDQHGSGRRPVSQQEEHDHSGADLEGNHRQSKRPRSPATPPSRAGHLRLRARAGILGQDLLHLAAGSSAANDWRKKFFFLSNGSTPCNDNLKLWSSSGNWNNPTGNYVINYKAILNWIVNTGTNPFPSQLRAGNVLYYTAIPTDVPASAYTWSNSNSQITNQDQRFWKEYIDFTLGVWADPFGNIQTPGNPSCSYGPDFQAGSGELTLTITGPDCALRRPDLDRSERQPAAAAASVLVRPDDNDPVHARHGHLAGHGPGHFDDCGQAGHSGRLPGHSEQPSQRHGVVDPVQPARASPASRPRPDNSASRRS